MFLFWRALYGLLASGPFITGIALVLRVIRAFGGQRAADALIARGLHRFAYSGWPTHQRPWINLHMARLFQQVRRAVDGAHPVATPRPPRMSGHRPLRIGCIAPFSGHLGLPAAL